MDDRPTYQILRDAQNERERFERIMAGNSNAIDRNPEPQIQAQIQVEPVAIWPLIFWVSLMVAACLALFLILPAFK